MHEGSSFREEGSRAGQEGQLTQRRAEEQERQGFALEAANMDCFLATCKEKCSSPLKRWDTRTWARPFGTSARNKNLTLAGFQPTLWDVQ